MNFDFTPNDIISGTVDYSLEAFLRSLFEQTLLEVEQMITANDPEWKSIINGWYKLNAEVCYAAAGQCTLEDLCKGQQREGSRLDHFGLYKVLKNIEKNNADNIKIMVALATRENLNAHRMGINEEKAQSLTPAEVSRIVNQVLEEEGLSTEVTQTSNYIN